MADLGNLGVDLFAIQHELHQKSSLDVSCPKCNANHEYKPAVTDLADKKDLQVYFSGGEVRCFKCDMESSESMYALGNCGHVLCGSDFESLGGKTGDDASNLDCPTCRNSNNDSVVTSPVSHGARVISISGTESCPICWEDIQDAPMIALACGHIFCKDDFQRLGGKIGQDALLTLEEAKQRQQDQVQQLRSRYGTAIPQLLETLSSADEENNVGATLYLLSLATTCENGDSATFLRLGGPAAMVEIMRRFQQSRLVQGKASYLLGNLLCAQHRSEEDQRANARAIMEAGAMVFCIDMLRDEQTSVPVLVSIVAYLVLPMFESSPFRSALMEENAVKLKSIVGALLHSMERNSDVVVLQGEFINALKGLTMSDDVIGPAFHAVNIELVELGGAEAIAGAMRRFPGDAYLQEKAIGTLCHIGHTSQLVPRIHGAIALTCQAMQNHLAAYYVQRNSCNFLWAVANCPQGDQAEAVEEALIANHAVQHLKATLLFYPPAAAEIQVQSCSALENMANSFERVGLEIVRTGCMEAVIKVIKHQNIDRACFQAALVLSRLSDSDEHDIRVALTSSDAIPALQMIYSQVDSIIMSPFQGGMMQFVDSPSDPFLLLQMSELIGAVLGKLGVQDIHMMGEDDYDFDEEEDSRGEIEGPPFDITSITDKDLSLDDTPGWFKNKPFCIDYDRSQLLSREHGQRFLCPPVTPEVGQQVVIRVSLPFGGRGFLYGAITRIADAPTDEDLRASGSKIFENGCKCTDPDCKLQNGTRKEILAAIGTVHGQEVTATVSLDSPYLERKLRFAPLPSFFGGESTRYNTVLRWNEVDGMTWNVVKISKHGN